LPGQFEDNKKHGEGTMDYANGGTYTGDWLNDVRTGKGICIYENAERYK
jgi:hypothetical protein